MERSVFIRCPKGGKGSEQKYQSMLERRLEQMKALLQTTKNHNHNVHYQDLNSYRHLPGPPSPDFRKPTRSVGIYSAHDHTSYRSPDVVSMARGPGDKLNLQNTDRNLPVASIETPPLDYVHAAFDNYQTINRPLSIKYPMPQRGSPDPQQQPELRLTRRRAFCLQIMY
jgi:hypothetical protein